MKKIFFLTICFLILTLFYVGPVFAKTCTGTGSPVECGDLGSGEVLEMTVVPYDDEGNIIWASVTYTWTVIEPAANPTSFGALTGKKVSGSWVAITPSVTTVSITNNTGGSSVQLTASSSGSGISGQVSVTANYGNGSATKVFKANTKCTADPVLYYGIGGVSVATKNNFQYSTAEVLSTCRPEYRLYEGDGSK